MTFQQPVQHIRNTETKFRENFLDCTALNSGFLLLDSCIRFDSSEESNWAVMVDIKPFGSSEQLEHARIRADTYQLGRL